MSTHPNPKSVWALFADGTAARAVMDNVPASQSLELVRKTMEEGGVARAAETAIQAAFSALKHAKMVPDGPLGFTYGFEKKSARSDEGGSLAFAACLVKKLAGLSFSVAAMGCVESTEYRARVQKVLGSSINERIIGAMAVLDPGDLVLVPLANRADVWTETGAMISGKGLTLRYVATVEETVNVLLGKPVKQSVPRPKAVRKRRGRLWMKILLILLLALAAVLAWHYKGKEMQELVSDGVETGLIEGARQGLEEKAPAPEKAQVQKKGKDQKDQPEKEKKKK